TAQRLFQKENRLDAIRVAAKSGVSDASLVRQISAVLPTGTQVKSGAEQAKSDAKDVNSFISFLQKALLAFAGIALFVGAFVIANTLSITVAQRAREFATLRTLGASLRPELRATRVPPIAAVREGAVLPPSRFARFGPVVSLGLIAISIALLVYG